VRSRIDDRVARRDAETLQDQIARPAADADLVRPEEARQLELAALVDFQVDRDRHSCSAASWSRPLIAAHCPRQRAIDEAAPDAQQASLGDPARRLYELAVRARDVSADVLLPEVDDGA